MAFADIFTAITEDRPYRQGMDRNQVLGVMKQLVEHSTLCPFVYKMVVKYYDVLDSVRREAQGRASAKYNTVLK